MKDTISQLYCIACDTVHAPDTHTFACKACGDLLEVRHDVAAQQSQYPNLKKTFDERMASFDLPYVSGVWRYHELILPDLHPDKIVSLPEGNTPLYRRDRIEEFVGAKTVYIKHEGQNPTLSFKDRGMTAGVSWANHLGVKRVACASTGDTSAAMAAYAASAGLPGVVLLPHEKISVEQLAQPIGYGARVLSLRTDFDGCMALVQQLTESGEIYLLNSMNPWRIEGQKAITIEALHQLRWQVPDWFVIPVGNAGNITAMGKALLELYELGLIDRLPRIAGVQVQAANPFFQAYQQGFKQRVSITAQATVASAIQIGNPVSFDKAREMIARLSGVVTEVDDALAMEAKAVAEASGVSICPNSGTALAGTKRLRDEGVIAASDSVVVIATAHGAKFSKATIEYHNNPAAQASNPPRVLDATLQAVLAEL